MLSRRRTLPRASRTWIQTAGFAAAMLTARASLADHYEVPSGSMEPTVQVGDHILVSKVAYGLRVPMTSVYLAHTAAPHRGDVVVLSSPVDGTVLLKRVVATEGERVDVRNGHVEIAGEPIAADHANLAYGGGPDFGPTRVPPGKLLVMGDNRGNSSDGRVFGWVDRDAVLGRAMAVVWRHGRFAWIGL